MKLIKNDSADQGSGQCRQITNSGSRCSRDAVQAGYCSQHYRLLKEKGLLVDATGNDKLEEIPEVPEGLEKTGRQNWHRYCQYLIDQGRLFQVYLMGIANLCYLEEQLEDTKKKLAEEGAVNIYDQAIQRNGYASHFDKLLGHIRNLRSDYGLTVSSDKSLSEATDISGESTSSKPGLRAGREKNW